MSKTAADPNDPGTKVNRAISALKSVERRQKKAFENFSVSWKSKRAEVLVGIDEKTFAGLLAMGIVNSHDASKRTDALATKEAQETTGNEPEAGE